MSNRNRVNPGAWLPINEEEDEVMECPVGMTLREARTRNREFIEQFGRAPNSPDELVAWIAMREFELEEQLRKRDEELRAQREAEKATIAQVQFHGNSTKYSYRVDEPFEIGDYLEVYSPHSCRYELVQVVNRGRGSHPLAQGHLKEARRVLTHSDTGAFVRV